MTIFAQITLEYYKYKFRVICAIAMKETFEEVRTDPDGNLIIHGHSFVIDLFDEGYNEHINGARIKDEHLKIKLERLSETVNADGSCVGQWIMLFRQGYKMGEVFDCLPYGIIDKTITGLGATTLELLSEVRNSIIVVPTKALAYNKSIMANSAKENPYCLYVGSSIGDIKKDTHIEIVQEYLLTRANKVKKFIVVADSLPMLLDYLLKLGEDVFNNYFLMVDEIDTMQDDSAYRPKLEAVVDNYFSFKYYNRAAVSATIRDFSDPRLKTESRLKIEWEKQPKRNIATIHTNYVDDVVWNLINEHLKTDTDKILVAYNSLDGILNIIKHLDISSAQCGILCSERSVKKIRNFIKDDTLAIDYKGHLNKRITFMTCAYFAGIDITDKCHLISVSIKIQPFTYLSVNKLTQIAGRLRNGILSETIVYDTGADKTAETNKNYQSKLIDRANVYSDFLNNTSSIIARDKALIPLQDFLYSYMEFTGKSKPTYNSYPLSIVRIHSIDKRFVPAYLNIDALVETLFLKSMLYKDKHTLVRALKQEGHNVNATYDAFISDKTHDSATIYHIKNHNRAMLSESFDELRDRLIKWHKQGRNKYRLKEIQRDTNKRLQDNVIDYFARFSEYINPEELLRGLEACYTHDRKLRNYINAVVFHILPLSHPFKASLIMGFEIDTSTFSSSKYIKTEQRHNILRQALIAECKYNHKLSNSVLSDLLNSFFCWARSAKGDRIKGLNPLGLAFPLKTLSIQENIISMLIFPKLPHINI